MSKAKEIDQAFLTAMRNKAQTDLSVLRMLKAALKNKEIELRKELSDEQALVVLQSEVKKRHDSIDAYQQGNRPELADKEAAEIEVLKQFLPIQLSEEEVKTKVEAALNNLPEEERADFGKAMKAAMAELKGQADGGLVSGIVKELLQ